VPVQFTVQAEGPYDFGLSVSSLARFPSEVVDVYRDGVYRRVIALSGKLCRISASVSADDPARISVVVDGPEALNRDVAAIEPIVRHILGLDVKMDGFITMARNDPLLSPLLFKYEGLRMTNRPGLFEALVMCITTQQINLTFAYNLKARLVHRFGQPLHLDFEDWYAFPAPEALAWAEVAELRSMQYSERKAEYIIGLARMVSTGDLDLDALSLLDDESFIEAIVRIRGLGRWSAEWALCRGLGRPDVVAADDIGVQRAISRYCCAGQKVTAAQVRELAEKWRPYRSYAIHYLLTALYHRIEPWYAPAS
jgi:DNA-3-methyladenine glycosylase II